MLFGEAAQGFFWGEQEWVDDISLAGQYASEALDAGAFEEIHEDGFYIIILMMCRGNVLRTGDEFAEPCVAQLAGGHLDRAFVFGRIGGGIEMANVQGLVIASCEVADEGFIAGTLLSSQLEICMGRYEIETCLVTKFAEGHRVEASAEREQPGPPRGIELLFQNIIRKRLQ